MGKRERGTSMITAIDDPQVGSYTSAFADKLIDEIQGLSELLQVIRLKLTFALILNENFSIFAAGIGIASRPSARPSGGDPGSEE